MVLQRLLISSNGYDDMYFRGGELRDGSILIKQNSSVSFDTYFNCFSYSKFKKYTSVKEITISLDIEGEATLSLYALTEKGSTLLSSCDVNCENASISVSLDSLSDDGILYPVVYARSDCTIRGGEISTNEPCNYIDCAIAICTFKRESEVTRNIEILNQAELSSISKIYVIDNGKTLDINALSSKRVSIIPNKNYGGSGGFTRGIMEAKAGGHSHVILMDDDVIINPEILNRMCAITSLLSDTYRGAHVSAAMLPLSKPYLQYEMGARWDGGAVKSFKQNIDVRKPKNLLECCKEENVQYGGWWCFMLPLSNTDKIGLPYPMFIKFDDIEYGKRCSSLSPIITMNGIAITHEDFNTKFSVHLDYYKLRNQLITTATHNMKNRLGIIFRLMKTSANSLFLYRYDAMPLIFRAFDDFLRGPDFLLSTNEEELNSEIMKMSPRAVPLSEIDGWDEGLKEQKKSKKTGFFKGLFMVLTLGGHLVPRFMLKNKISAFPPLDAKPVWAFMHKRTIQYQLGSDYGFDFGRSCKRFFGGFFKCIGMAFKILFKYGKVKRAYVKKKDYLSSFEFWEKHLEIQKLSKD